MPHRPSFWLAGLVLAGSVGCASEPGARSGPPALGGQPGGGQAGQASSAGGGSGGSTGGSAVAVGGSGPAGGVGGSGGQATSAAGSTAAGTSSFTGSPVVFVGGFGEAPVRHYDLDKATGVMTERPSTIDAGPEPTCFAIDPSRKYLYVGNEGDSPQGGITSYALQPDGSVTFLNHRSGSDDGYTSLVVHPSGKFIAGAAYSGGSSSIFPLLADGSVGAQVSVADFGSGAQAHCVAYDLPGKHLLVATKGTDSVQQLLHSDEGVLTPNSPPDVPAAAGPRHLAVHPNGKLVFVVAESGSALTTYQLSSDGKLTETAEISSLPAEYEGSNTGAHVELSSTGQFLYVSNRGHDSIGAFSVNQENGALTLIEFEPARGESPHDFDLDPSGQILIAANRRSATLTVFEIATDGSLAPLGEPVPTREDPTAVLIHYPN